MQLDKKKYSKKEVLLILDAYKREYEKRFLEQRQIISRLNEEIKTLEGKLSEFHEREGLVLSTLLRAEQTADQIKNNANHQYSLEIERLKKFTARWDDYFKKLMEKYPLYPPTKQAVELNEMIKSFSGEVDPKQAIDELEKRLPQENEGQFEPKAKIRDYIAATSDNGFNLNEVLNPGELKLEDICKELGLIDSNE